MFFSVSRFWMKIVEDLEGLYLFTRMVSTHFRERA